MKYLQFLGIFLVVAGSFMPLVKIPIVGNWDYWKIDHSLAVMVWVICLLTFIFSSIKKQRLVKAMSFLMIILFVFTIVAVKLKSLDYFSFLPFRSWQNTFSGIVKLSWGWFVEFLGACIIFGSSTKNINTTNK